MFDDFRPGSDPGLYVAAAVPIEVISYGKRVQRELIKQQEARELAAVHGLYLEGLSGTEGGVIGALAAVGLAVSGEDGRYLHIGTIRDLEGMQSVSAVLAAGIKTVQTADETPAIEGLVLTDKMRPARRGGQPVLFFERQDDDWLSFKLD